MRPKPLIHPLMAGHTLTQALLGLWTSPPAVKVSQWARVFIARGGARDAASAWGHMRLQVKRISTTFEATLGCRTRKDQAEELTGQLTEEQKEEFAALEELGSTAEQVCAAVVTTFAETCLCGHC